MNDDTNLIDTAYDSLLAFSHQKTKREDQISSHVICGLIIGCRLIESLFFLVMPVARPLKILYTLPIEEKCEADMKTRQWLVNMAILLLILLVLINITMLLFILLVLVLFILDMYMRWILWSTLFGAMREFFLGLSILSPWRNIFARLPERLVLSVSSLLEMSYTNTNPPECMQS